MALLTTKSSNMPLLPLLLCALMAVAVAQLRCDPLTQYMKDGKCCNMCGPGTSMTSYGSCLEPHCKACGASEYQEKYTNESKCLRQPYCDTNIGFELPVHDTKKRTVCKCKAGFYCSSAADCSFCRQHSSCQPGSQVKTKGDDMHDTACEKCPDGTFSNQTSQDSVCMKWTECGDQHRVAQKGTDTSDNICEEISRTHIIVIAVVIGILIILFALVAWLLRGRQGDVEGQVKQCCVESCLPDKNEPVKLMAVTPTEPEDEECMLNGVQPHPDESLRSPEESDEPSLEMSSDFQSRQLECYTENGKFVAQENGATEKLSRQESQPQAYTD